MAANAVQIADHEQSIQILKHQNTKLCEQLATKKEQIEALEGSVQKYEEEKKRFADTLLCVNRLWTQFTGDIQTLAKRNAAGAAPAAAAPPGAADASPNAASLAAAAAQAAAALAAGEQAAAAAAASDPDAELDPLVWDSFDPFLARLLQADAASSNRLLKKHTQAYLSELSTVEEALHARAAAGLEALASLLDAIEARGKAAAEQQEQLRQLSPDEALTAANQQLQEQVAQLQDQLKLATALQRQTNALLKQAEDRAFEATDNLKSIRNDLADKEFALQTAQRKLAAARQQQQQQQPQAQGAAAAAGSAGGAPPAAAAAGGGGAAGAAAAGGESAEEAAAAAIQELQAQVSQLQGMLEQRTAEKDEQVEAAAQLRRELEAAKAHVGDESWVTSSSLAYKQLQQQLAEANTQAQAVLRQLAEAQASKNECMRLVEGKTQQAENERILRSQVLHLQQQVNELNTKQIDLLGQKQQLQLAHQQEVARYGHLKTSEELQSMLAALQKEVDTNAGHARKAAEASGAADAARQEALELRSQLAAAHTTIKALQVRLQHKSSELQGLSGREEELKERLNDLNAFVEVLTTVVSDARDLLEVRRSEASLKAQLAEAQAKLKGDAPQQQLTAASATEADLRKQLEAAVAEAATLQGKVAGLQQQVAALEAEVKNKQQESEAFANEIGDALNAFEQQRTQNSTLLAQLTERDAALNALKAEKLAVQQQLEAVNETLSGVRMRVASLEGEVNQAKALQEAVEKDFARTSSDLAAAREQLVSQSTALEGVKAELKAVQDSKAALQLVYDKERATSESRKQAADKAADELRQEAAKRQRLEDTNRQLAGRIERANRNSEKSEEEQHLEAENRAMRKLLLCSVCDQRQKNVVITKCYHMFCNVCTDSALAARNRQCPSCGHKYNQSDVKPFYFT